MREKHFAVVIECMVLDIFNDTNIPRTMSIIFIFKAKL